MAKSTTTAVPIVTSRKTVFPGKRFHYEQLTVQHPSGHVHTRELVRHPGACIIVPRLDDGRIILIRCWRASVEKPLLELPAGTLEPGEPPIKTAGRELIEEAGYEAGEIVPLGDFYTSPGLSDEVMHAFFATNLKHVGQQLEPYEHITLVPVTPAAAFAALDSGELRDAKSMLALFLAQRRGLI